jgi:hypothetical protein
VGLIAKSLRLISYKEISLLLLRSMFSIKLLEEYNGMIDHRPLHSNLNLIS